MYTITKSEKILKSHVTRNISRVLSRIIENDGCYNKIYYSITQAGIMLYENISAYETNIDRAFNLYNSLQD